MSNKFFKPVMALFAVGAFLTSALSFANVNKDAKVANVKVSTTDVTSAAASNPGDWTFITANYIYTGTTK